MRNSIKSNDFAKFFVCVFLTSIFICGSKIFAEEFDDGILLYSLNSDFSAHVVGLKDKNEKQLKIPNKIFKDDCVYTVTKIKKEAFYDENIDRVEFENGIELEEICDGAFYGTDIKMIIVPASVKKIGAGTFANCKSLISLNFEQGSCIEEMGEGVFAHSAIKMITIPPTVKEIKTMFFDCENLKFVTITNNTNFCHEEDEMFYNCHMLQILRVVGGVDNCEIFKLDNGEMFESKFDRIDIVVNGIISETQFIRKGTKFQKIRFDSGILRRNSVSRWMNSYCTGGADYDTDTDIEF